MPSTRTVRFASALRDTWKAGYHLPQLRADFLAGITVGIVALPLSMALAIASGVPPQHGLYTAIVPGH
jgi:SulP family sulfate permease